jgi:uncharacterized protein
MRGEGDRTQYHTGGFACWALRFSWVVIAGLPLSVRAACPPGIYGAGSDAFVVLGPVGSASASGQRYLFLDGRRGGTADTGSPVVCANDVVLYDAPEKQKQRWPRIQTVATDASFVSAATRLAGELIEPPGPRDRNRPLVVMVHGSEKTPAIGNVYAYMLVAQGISVFV